MVRIGIKSVLTTLGLTTALAGFAVADDLPVVDPGNDLAKPLSSRDGSIRNPFSWEALHNIVGSQDDGLLLDLGDPDLEGRIYTGPYPFEAGDADYDYARYRSSKSLTSGTGTVEIDRYFSTKYNVNNWPEGQCEDPADCPTPTIGYRVMIDGKFYDGRYAFTGEGSGPFEPQLSILEGPLVGMINSDDPSRALISVTTSGPAACQVEVSGMGTFSGNDPAATRHEIWLSGLMPLGSYDYQVICSDETDTVRSMKYSFRAAPPTTLVGKNMVVPNDLKVTFGFGSDSREGPVGERAFMGHNFYVLNQIAMQMERKNAQFYLFGGDLVNGYTSEVWDFETQLKGWKKSLEGFMRSHPVYTAMGNHETLVNTYDDGSHYGLSLDKWPYDTDSAEARFAAEFMNPTNGPAPSDLRRPQYTENVYSFQWGPVLCIAFNNNYWWTSNGSVPIYGGSPEGYMLPDQLDWIEAELSRAEADKSIRYIFLYAQEPVFPAGGHVKDAMWWRGDNNVKAYQKLADGTVAPAGPGIIETRNRFWEAISGSSKVAAVLTGDEHAYHRLQIDDTTPVGVVSQDDLDGDGVLDQYSPNPDFVHPTWQITAGNAGAPWYNREETPWGVDRYNSQIGYVIFEADYQTVSMTAYALTGEVIDHVEDLMAIKKK